MEGRKLLDAHVLIGLQKIAKLIVQTVLPCEYLRLLFLFTILYVREVKKQALFNKFLSQKFQEERDVGYEERKEITFRILYSGHIHYSLNKFYTMCVLIR